MWLQRRTGARRLGSAVGAQASAREGLPRSHAGHVSIHRSSHAGIVPSFGRRSTMIVAGMYMRIVYAFPLVRSHTSGDG